MQQPAIPTAKRQAERQAAAVLIVLVRTRLASRPENRETIPRSQRIGAMTAGTLGIIGKVCAV